MLLNEIYKVICRTANDRESLILENSLGLLDHNTFVDMYHTRNLIIDLLISEYHMLGGKRRVDHYHREDIVREDIV